MLTLRRCAVSVSLLMVLTTAGVMAPGRPAIADPPRPSLCFRGGQQLASCDLAGNPVGKAPGEKAWLREARRTLAPVPTFLQQRLRSRLPGERLAVVTGVDDVALGFHFRPNKVIPPTRDLLRTARQLGYAVFFVTGQFESRRGKLRRKLAKAGYEYDGLCMRQRWERARVAKLRCRSAISASYTIVVNASASSVSFKDGHYERGYSMPNYRGWWN